MSEPTKKPVFTQRMVLSGNAAEVDLFLAADTATPQDLLVNHFELVAPYNSSRRPPLFTFNYAGGLLALLSNTHGVDLSCATGTCGYSSTYSTVAIADPALRWPRIVAVRVHRGRSPPCASAREYRQCRSPRQGSHRITRRAQQIPDSILASFRTP
jgi:hypothetical protein